MSTNINPDTLISQVHSSADCPFRAQCDTLIHDLLAAAPGIAKSPKDILHLLYYRLFNTYPNRIELSFDGEYLNPKVDTISKQKLISTSSDTEFVVDEDTLECFTKEEYLKQCKDPRDMCYTFRNKEILQQSTYTNIINNYPGSKIAAYRLDEEPIIILGDNDYKIIVYYMEHFIYVLTAGLELPKYIKDNVVLESEDEDEHYFEYVVYDNHGFDTTSLPVKKQNIDLAKNYNDDLPHEEIMDFIQGDKSGLCILYGLPGTGKTSYIRHLMHTCQDAEFMILNTSCFDAINDSSFVNMIISNKDSVVILEDCEDLLIERNSGGNSRIATLLNLSDGILGDALRLKFICTFNSKISKIDTAVLRKGRTHVKYEFKPLCNEKAQKLAEEIGHTLPPKKGHEGYTLAEIYYSDNDLVTGNVNSKIGF